MLVPIGASRPAERKLVISNRATGAQLVPVPGPNAVEVSLRVQLDDPTRLTALRDYFLRLGATAVLDGDATVDVRFEPGDDIDAASFLRTWAAMNDVTATTATAPVGLAVVPSPKREVAPKGDNPFVPPVRLGDLMVSKGFIDVDQLSQALVESKETGQLVGRVLLRRGWVFEDELARTLAEQWKLPYVRLSSVGVDHSVMRLLPREIGIKFAAVPVRFTDQSVLVAFADPSDPGALAAVREYLPSIKLAVAEFSDIRMLWS
jgi:Type II secretion system (T2SS), protein E, N-terminal domain